MDLKNIDDIKTVLIIVFFTNKDIAKNQLEQIVVSMPSH
jgi:hypothetical protein